MNKESKLSDDPVVLLRQINCQHGWIVGPNGPRCAHCGLDQTLLAELRAAYAHRDPRKSN